MKKHAVVIGAVLLLLAGIYLVGRHSYNTSSGTAPHSAVSHSGQNPTPTAFNKAQYSLIDPSSLWVVVNKQRPLKPIRYAPTDLLSVGNGQFMRTQAATAFSQLQTAAKAAGYDLIAESGYRSYDTQVTVYDSEVKAYGQASADTESARPGHSEHQTGWAVDIGSPNCFEDCFGTQPGSKWLLANAYIYGFILRYPVDKGAITGYRNEPWHFRYVGSELSTEMYRENITTLEEFFGLPAAPNY